MRRPVFFVFAVLCVLVLGDQAVSANRTYQDPPGGQVYALDITSVLVSDATPGYFIVDIDTPNYDDITDQDQLWVFLNTDRNRSNNYFGADYALKVTGSSGGPVCGLYGHWNGINFTLVRALSCPFFRGTTFMFSRADVGNPPDFEFWVQSYWTPPPGVDESDRAPDSGWWLYDPTPPQTTITAGPSGSTPDRNASLTFSSNESGSTFQCSLDGAAFSACGSPANYQNLAFAAHTFQVRATDPSGNTDPSPASRAWTVIDGTAPTAKAVRGTCCEGGQAEVRYTIADNSGSAETQVSIRRIGRSKPSKVCSFGTDRAQPNTYVAECEVPLKARGWLKFCVQAKDAAGLASGLSCKPLKFARLYARPVYKWKPAGGNAVRITSWTLANLGGGHPSIRCLGGCTFRRVGTILPRGARIEVRVIKPRIRGSYIRLTSTGNDVYRPRDRCLPPGLTGPVVSCSRSS
jgi:hypothetical protein